MKKILSFLTILGVFLVLSGIVNGVNCSKYAEQVDEIRSALEEARMNADGYAKSATVQASSRGLSLSVAANMNTQNPYPAQVGKLEQLLILAEQDYQNCLNYSQNEIEQEIIDIVMEAFEDGENYFNLGIKYLSEKDPQKSMEEFAKSYGAYKAIYNKYKESRDIRNIINSRYDIKPLLSESFFLLGANACAIGQKKMATDILSNAIELNNKEAEDLYDVCNSLTQEDTDNLRCSAKYGDAAYGYRTDEGKLRCRWELTQEEADKTCQEKHGINSIGKEKDGNRYCGCKAGYKSNKETGYCTVDSSNAKTEDSITVNNGGSTKKYNNEYSDEYNRAYEYAYENGITTMPTIEQANMNGYITRAEISKMFSEWALKHGSTIDTSKSCKFNDISSVKGDLHDYIIKSCQLGVMGQGIKNFRPYDTISRAEVFTVISRMLRGNKYDGCDPYYSCHESAIARAGIYSDMWESERIQEFRGNVMMYLMRASEINI